MVRLTSLDAFRGFAALIVLIYHVAAVYGLGGHSKGYLAVDFFFMLSGFVIERVLQKSSRTPLQFMRARYIRFWPTMAAGTLLGLLFIAQPGWVGQALMGFLLIPLFAGKFVFPLNPPAWSIFFELSANALHSAVRRSWLLIFLVSLTWLTLTGGFGGGPNPGNFLAGAPRVLTSYSLGVLMYQRWGEHPPVNLPSACGLLLAALLLPFVSPLFDYGFVLLLCPVIILSGVRGNIPFAEELGALSFPLYAVHYPILLSAKANGLHPAVATLLVIASAAALSAAAANWTWRREPRPQPSC
jgi:peptidoglycan/LPS O-acetylase OafA/YrhL